MKMWNINIDYKFDFLARRSIRNLLTATSIMHAYHFLICHVFVIPCFSTERNIFGLHALENGLTPMLIVPISYCHPPCLKLERPNLFGLVFKCYSHIWEGPEPFPLRILNNQKTNNEAWEAVFWPGSWICLSWITGSLFDQHNDFRFCPHQKRTVINTSLFQFKIRWNYDYLPQMRELWARNLQTCDLCLSYSALYTMP